MAAPYQGGAASKPRCNTLGAMLIYSMSVSVDGFIADREGAFGWTVPSEELFRFHISQVRELGGYLLGRRLYETMLPWETDPSMRDNELWDVFADVWCAIPKVVFSRTLDSVQGNARLAKASVADAAAEKAPQLACLHDVKSKLLLVGDAPPECALAVGDKAVHRDAHRIDQHGFRLSSQSGRRSSVMRSIRTLRIGLSFVSQWAPL